MKPIKIFRDLNTFLQKIKFLVSKYKGLQQGDVVSLANKVFLLGEDNDFSPKKEGYIQVNKLNYGGWLSYQVPNLDGEYTLRDKGDSRFHIIFFVYQGFCFCLDDWEIEEIERTRQNLELVKLNGEPILNGTCEL